jgi:UDP-N-acetyl-D-glucosamine/UDP-N-acetyl-D-galactosamine dehydrogenase
MLKDDIKIAVIGLGYAGLPLAVHFAKKYHTIGFDLKEKIIINCMAMNDPTGEVSDDDFRKAVRFFPTKDASMISKADFIIVAVPTPMDKAKQPDLGAVEKASAIVGQHMKKNTIVIFESIVYLGVTEEICVPILEKTSQLKWKEDFHVGYSPERINPGDKEHTLSKIVKVVSGDDKETLQKVASLYESIIDAGVHKTNTIKEAEVAKVFNT